MAKINARVEGVEKRIAQLNQLYQELNADHMDLRATVKKETPEITQKLDQLFRKLGDIERRNPSNPRHESGMVNSIPIQKPTELSPNSDDRERIVLEFPRFSGENPGIWIGKCRRYFLLCPTPEREKVLLASMYMEDKAESFYTNYVEGRDDIGWERFLEMVLERFDDPRGKDVDGAFKNLQQEESVEMYVEKFEQLKASMAPMNTVLKEEYFVACFLYGLKKEIRDVILNFSPTTLTRAIQLAKLQETGLENLLQKLFQEKLYQKEKEGLCLTCGGPDSYGHKCEAVYEEEEEEEEEVEEDSRASFYSVAVANTPNPNVVKGMVKKEPISIILVSASSHSFLDPQAARRLGCKIEHTKRFLVTTITGSEIECNSKVSGFKWQMGGVTFTADVRIMELEWYGCELVLGMDFFTRMESIGFGNGRIIFTTPEGKEVVLQTGFR